VQYRHLLRRQKSRMRSKHAELLRNLVPDALGLFAPAVSEEEVWMALAAAAERAQLDRVEVVETRPDGEETIVFAAGSRASGSEGLAVVSARYPVGREETARVDIQFRWRSDFGDVSPQSEVLLQVVVDIVERCLTRLRSRHAPAVLEPAAAPEVAATEPLRARVSEP
jgi:UDP-GlcNAc:undecaprenyl-phosphate/decaprenyl-phosphate GlcNAc-1-phosphate transferase